MRGRKKPAGIPALTEADLAAGIRMDGDKLVFPPPVVAPLHSEHKGNFCPKCHQHWRECGCLIDSTALDNKPHIGRPWGFKGAQHLPDSHPDSPHYKP